MIEDERWNPNWDLLVGANQGAFTSCTKLACKSDNKNARFAIRAENLCTPLSYRVQSLKATWQTGKLDGQSAFRFH